MYSNFKAITRCKQTKNQRIGKARSNLRQHFCWRIWQLKDAIMNPLEDLSVWSKKNFFGVLFRIHQLKFRYTDAVLLRPCFTGRSFTEYRDSIHAVLRDVNEEHPGQLEDYTCSSSVLCTTVAPITHLGRHMTLYQSHQRTWGANSATTTTFSTINVTNLLFL